MHGPTGEVSPADRTVGQLVADAIRFYGERFWRVLWLGLVIATFNQFAIGQNTDTQSTLLAFGSPFFTLAYIGACVLVAGERPARKPFLVAVAAGVVVFLPVALLVWIFVLPALAWLAFAGLAVPVALFEGRPFRESLRQAGRLSGAGYIHALGTLATLVLVYFLSRSALLFLLHGQGGAALRTAAFLADLVLSPLIFVGSALLYFDQKARLESVSPRPRRRDARLHHAHDLDSAGRADAEVESGSPAPGER
jgi:hypothetical protein